jgi:hypothetical protein
MRSWETEETAEMGISNIKGHGNHMQEKKSRLYPWYLCNETQNANATNN